VELPLESVPNVSEGRDHAVIDAVGASFAAHARLLDVHTDPDHNRSVFTLVGDEHELVEALLSGIACAREQSDLRTHAGAHPRIGVAVRKRIQCGLDGAMSRVRPPRALQCGRWLVPKGHLRPVPESAMRDAF